MDSRYELQQKKRKDIFKKIVQLAYQNKLKEKIDDLPEQFSTKNKPNKLTAVKNEILIAMGLNPNATYDTELASQVDAALNLKEVTKPLVTINKPICKECLDKTCTITCINNKNGLLIDDGHCISCGKCIPRCPEGAITDKIEFIPLVKYLQKNIPIYANVAPAIVGQFGENITPGMLRSALKAIGFTDMVEVALFADILTLREADEYNQLIKTKDDFLITSCCCPIWVNLLTKNYPKLDSKLTKTVSPMIASGRIIKTIFPKAITVFIGPCVAKKAEAKAPELKGAIDYVLTFAELKEIFQALEINLAEMPDDQKEQSSFGGRIYGRTGGVSEAVRITVERIAPSKNPTFKAEQADGIAACNQLLEKINNNQIEANFIEGMGCKGGCVGGPKKNISTEKGTKKITEFSENSLIQNPIDNKNVAHILRYLKALEKKEETVLDQLSFDKILLRNYHK